MLSQSTRFSLIVLLIALMIACSPSSREDSPDREANPDTVSQSSSRQEEAGEADSVIRINQPSPGQVIHSPLTITGVARGYWYFEGDFKVSLTDQQGNELTAAVASAQGEWMTEEFVPFTAEMSFESPDDERGYLVFQRANPSGLPENAEEHRLAVVFGPK